MKISVRLTEQELEDLERLRQRWQMDTSAVIRRLIHRASTPAFNGQLTLNGSQTFIPITPKTEQNS